MKTPSTVDLGNFNRGIHALAGFAGVSVDRAIEYEAGKVLEAAIRYTPAASATKIRSSVENAAFTTLDGKAYKLSHRYPDALWQRISRQKKEGLRRKMRARGLSKQSWLKLADEVGLRVAAPAFVSKALPRDGKSHPENARASRVRTKGRWAIYFENSQPTVNNPFVGGRRAIARALQGRIRYFEQNLRRGVFSELKQIAARYPGLTVT